MIYVKDFFYQKKYNLRHLLKVFGKNIKKQRTINVDCKEQFPNYLKFLSKNKSKGHHIVRKVNGLLDKTHKQINTENENYWPGMGKLAPLYLFLSMHNSFLFKN